MTDDPRPGGHEDKLPDHCSTQKAGPDTLRHNRAEMTFVTIEPACGTRFPRACDSNRLAAVKPDAVFTLSSGKRIKSICGGTKTSRFTAPFQAHSSNSSKQARGRGVACTLRLDGAIEAKQVAMKAHGKSR